MGLVKNIGTECKTSNSQPLHDNVNTLNTAEHLNMVQMVNVTYILPQLQF